MRTKISGLALKAIVVVLVLITGTAWAQNPPTAEPPAGNTLPCYHKEVEDLGFLEGDWNVTLSTRLGDGQWEESMATSQIRRDLGGCLFMERFSGSRQKRPFQVLSLFAFDNHSKLFQQSLTDSEHGLLALYQGRKIEGEVLFDLPLIRDDGTRVTVRRAYSAVTRNSFTVENKHSPDGGKTWLIVVTARYGRKP